MTQQVMGVPLWHTFVFADLSLLAAASETALS